MNPKVSVIMSVYNGSRFLSQSISSILNQTFSDLELIIIDDASTDASMQIASQFASRDNRIRIIKNEKNVGLTKSLNIAIREVKGDYIARIDADDVSYPDRIRRQVDFLNHNKSCVLVGTWADIIDDKNKVLRTIKYPVSNSELKIDLIKYNPFFHSSIMLRKEVLDLIGAYHEDFKFAQDYELYFRIARNYSIANIPEVLIGYRESSTSITGQKNRKQIGFVIRAKLIALKNRQYSILGYVHVFRSCIAWLLPVSLKRYFKKLSRS